MSDIFREVDEDLRHEQYKKLWDRFGIYVIGLAVLIVLGVFLTPLFLIPQTWILDRIRARKADRRPE